MAVCHRVKPKSANRIWRIAMALWAMAKTSRPAAYSEVQRQIGERIRRARMFVMPNRSEFARILGVDTSTLAKIESGDRPPSVFNVIDIARRLRVSTDYILLGSMRGVDGELAALLAAEYPDMVPDRRDIAADRSRTALARRT